MTLSDYLRVKQQLLDAAFGIEDAKRPEYTVDNVDVLQNFKAVAARTGLTPLQVLQVYALKHEDAIARIMQKPNAQTAEPILGRFADRLNYLSLGLALLVEQGVDVTGSAQLELDLGPVSSL